MNSLHAEATRILTSTVASLLPRGTRCGLVMYPDHWNTGDSAIWWGTRMLLDRLGVGVDYACDPWSYDHRRLRTALPEGPILLLGGGNFGDVYGREQGLRIRVLEDFPDRKIVQLPQSIWFRSPAALDEMASLLARRRDFTLLVRDAASLALAQEHFPSTATSLCPDAALALELPTVDRTADVPVLALWRNDAESSAALPPLPEGWISRDWTLQGGILPADEARQLTTAGRSFKEWVGKPPASGEPCPLRRRLAWRREQQPWTTTHGRSPIRSPATPRRMLILRSRRVVPQCGAESGSVGAAGQQQTTCHASCATVTLRIGPPSPSRHQRQVTLNLRWLDRSLHGVHAVKRGGCSIQPSKG